MNNQERMSVKGCVWNSFLPCVGLFTIATRHFIYIIL